MSLEKTESASISELTKAQLKTLKTLREMLKKNSIENPSDAKWAQDALNNLPNGIRVATMHWLTSLVNRKGKRFVLSATTEVTDVKDSQK